MAVKAPVTQLMRESLQALDDLLAKRETALEDTKTQWDVANQRIGTLSKATYEQMLSEISSKKKQIQLDFKNHWKKTYTELRGLCKKVRLSQPYLDALDETSVNEKNRFMSGVTIGRVKLSHASGWEDYMPLVAPFPFKSALLIPSGEISRAQQLLLRLSQALPAGLFEFMVIDPLGMGDHLGVAKPLLQVPFLMKNSALTYSNEIQAMLQQEFDYANRMMQESFIAAQVNNWQEYNEKPDVKPLPYKVIIVFGLPEQMNEQSLWCLSRLVEKGPDCGILTILVANSDVWEDEKNKKWALPMKQHLSDMTDVSFLNGLKLKHITTVSEPEVEPKNYKLGSFFSALASSFEKKGFFVNPIIDMWPCEMWTEDSTDGLRVPLGWTGNGNPAYFHIGATDTPHHALLGGASGSGKSNLLHVLIHALAHRYAPGELDLYLLDYKEGVEFNHYTHPLLPHAKLIAVDGDPEYGVMVLKHLEKRMDDRVENFKKAGEKEFSKYRRNQGSRIPRILLIIDEFQELFAGSPNTSAEADRILKKLLRQGRSHGIHILLATQTLRGAVSATSGVTPSVLTSQIGCRIALCCQQEDSAIILGQNNDAATTLRMAKEALLNNENGAKSGNIIFRVPYADDDLCKKHLTNLHATAADQNISPKTKIFDGSRLPKLQSPKWYRDKVRNAGRSLFLGKALTYESSVFSIELERREGMNLLISGYAPVIQRGLALSMVRSLYEAKDIHQVIYFSTRPNPLLRCDDLPKKRFEFWNQCPEVLPELTEKSTVWIIDGLEQAHCFHPPTVPVYNKKPSDPLTPWDWLKNLLILGPASGHHVVAFCDNWKRCATAYTNAREFSYFAQRIAFNMLDDEAGAFLTGQAGIRIKGTEESKRAAFADMTQTGVAWFRPFAETVDE